MDRKIVTWNYSCQRDDQSRFTFLIQNKIAKRKLDNCHLELVMIER